jgi:quinolinate synthase
LFEYTETLDKELLEKIERLKKERNAVILAHNYQRPEVQDIADFVGDSLELSINAAKTEAEVIVFCGVHFMAETASILSPDKKVLLPRIDAGCRMADMITLERLRVKKRELPQAKVVCYVNSTAEIKAESYVSCTSANAVQVVQNLDAGEVLFVPDQYLGHYVATKVDKIIHQWPGYCPVHANIKPEHILKRKMEHPEAKVIVHPECTPQVIALADEVLSTGGMVKYALREDVKEVIVGTEIALLYRLEKENPGKKFIPASDKAICPNMKLITAENVLWSLEEQAPEVKVKEELRLKAKISLDRMFELGRK